MWIRVALWTVWGFGDSPGESLSDALNTGRPSKNPLTPPQQSDKVHYSLVFFAILPHHTTRLYIYPHLYSSFTQMVFFSYPS